MAASFEVPRQGGFDRFMDGVNRVPRPALALARWGCLCLLWSTRCGLPTDARHRLGA